MTESCEIHAIEQPILQPADQLFVAHRKRFSHAYETNEEGIRELRIYYGLKEISFDEQHLFPFGEQLVRQSEFPAEAATTWGPGYAWDEVRPLLEALLAEGILKLGGAEVDERGGGLVDTRVPPSVCPVARAWSAAECESITSDLGGRPVEIGYLESIIPVYRIVHPSLDADGRQVGEANVYPARLRLDRETEWRVCQYSGSRYRDEAPMNVTALKAMIKYWKPMMTMLLAIRGEVQKRLPRARKGWTVGDLHTMAVVVLCIPAYQQMKGGGASPPRPLHPILSSLFRITDGIRMTTHEMLFLSEERTRAPEEPMNAAELYGFAERNGIFLNDTGVCAGPKAMIEEFLSIAVDGISADRPDFPSASELPLELQALLAELPEAVDYALKGLQIWCLCRAAWLAMSRAYKQLRAIFEPVAADHPMREQLERDWQMMGFMRIAIDHERDVHADVYRDGYEQSWLALRAPLGHPSYDETVSAVPETSDHVAAARQLREHLSTQQPALDPATVGATVATLITYLREEQAVLQAVTALERSINDQLDRPRPTRPLDARDYRLYHGMREGYPTQFPYLLDSLAPHLGARVDCNTSSIAVSYPERSAAISERPAASTATG